MATKPTAPADIDIFQLTPGTFPTTPGRPAHPDIAKWATTIAQLAVDVDGRTGAYSITVDNPGLPARHLRKGAAAAGYTVRISIDNNTITFRAKRK